MKTLNIHTRQPNLGADEWVLCVLFYLVPKRFVFERFASTGAEAALRFQSTGSAPKNLLLALGMPKQEGALARF